MSHSDPLLHHSNGRVVLLSGGLDSAVCLALHPDALVLYVDYGQPHHGAEYMAAERLAAHYNQYLLRLHIRVPWWTECMDGTDSHMLVTGRNLALISLAATLRRTVVIGCNADDHDEYPDCRPEFFEALRALVPIETPLIDKTKAEIGQLARDLDVPVQLTWSCYYPTPDGECEQCAACEARARALA